MTQTNERKKAISIGGACIITYFMSYYMRNILGVVTPAILNEGIFSKEYIAGLSSIYMIFYSFGQLINGMTGDRIAVKYMVLIAYLLGGTAMLVFPYSQIHIVHFICFAVMGYGFSMLRGPLVKAISENTLPSYARVCCTFFSFSCHFGPFVTALFALIFKWRMVFTVSAMVAYATAAAGFVIFSCFERKGFINYAEKPDKTTTGKSSLFGVFFIKNFVIYMMIGMIVEISASSIAFWIPTYVNEYLRFSPEAAGVIFSVISLLKSVAPFMCLILFKLLGENDVKLIRIMFIVAGAMYAAMFFVTNVWINIAFFVVALAAAACASAALWSIYVPSLAKSKKVSSANGILDCSSYLAAALANIVFAKAMSAMGWSGIIIIWFVIMMTGLAITFCFRFSGKVKTTPVQN